jgi:hypothetical protein
MLQWLAFLELGGGWVSSMAFSASSNLIGASVSRSVLRGFGFFFDRLFTYSLSAPAGLSILLFEKVKLAGQPVPSNTLPVCEPFSFGLFNRNFHPFPVADCAVVPTEGKFISIALQVLPAHVMKRAHHTPRLRSEKKLSAVFT